MMASNVTSFRYRAISNQHQATSTNTKQCQRAPSNTNEHQAQTTNIKQHQRTTGQQETQICGYQLHSPSSANKLDQSAPHDFKNEQEEQKYQYYD